ncbi:MAG: hypothetical protein IT260_03380, partial [Saprospiraceae bacterium]|nr:hypothetical protein [Saprospiraceae bacterium]
MKKIIALLSFCWMAAPSDAQTCSIPAAHSALLGNDIQGMLAVDGSLFNNGLSELSDGHLRPDPGTDAITVFTAGLWLGALDPAGQPRISPVAYIR